MSAKWRAEVTPKLAAQFESELKRRKLKSLQNTRFMVRGTLEKDGSVHALRVDAETVHTKLSKAELAAVANALIYSIRQTAPMPYASVKDSNHKHLGLYVECVDGNLDPGLTMPSDGK